MKKPKKERSGEKREAFEIAGGDPQLGGQIASIIHEYDLNIIGDIHFAIMKYLPPHDLMTV